MASEKLKKQDGQPFVLTLVENPDVAKAVGEQKKPGQILVGFAAETEHLLENAQKKLDKKYLDMIVANDVTQAGAGFGVDTNIVTLISHQGMKSLPLLSKTEVADRILDQVAVLRAQTH